MSADRENGLPEGVIDADPPGGWESGDVADGESEAQNADAIDSPSLSDSGLPPSTPDGTDATADASPDAPLPPAGPVEGSITGADPDLVTDADLEQGRSEDPAADPGARERQEGL